MTTHKAIREATEEGPFYTAMVAKDDLRVLLADLDAKTEALNLIASAENSALDLAYCKGVARAALKGTP